MMIDEGGPKMDYPSWVNVNTKSKTKSNSTKISFNEKPYNYCYNQEVRAIAESRTSQKYVQYTTSQKRK